MLYELTSGGKIFFLDLLTVFDIYGCLRVCCMYIQFHCMGNDLIIKYV